MIANPKVMDRAISAFEEVRKLPHLSNLNLLGSALYLPNPTDIDIGALLHPGYSLAQYGVMLAERGWQLQGNYHGAGPTWNSFTKGDVNLLVMTSRERMEKFVLAMRVCEGLQLKERGDRIIVCQIIRDGMDPDTARMIARDLIKNQESFPRS